MLLLVATVLSLAGISTATLPGGWLALMPLSGDFRGRRRRQLGDPLG
ncbi:hypothetical protein [Microbacterium sp.]